MIAGRSSKTVAFVAILALTMFGALATASAQPADIKAIDKTFQDHYARGNYSAAQIEAQELERLVKARFGADHANYAVALRRGGPPSRRTNIEDINRRRVTWIGYSYSTSHQVAQCRSDTGA